MKRFGVQLAAGGVTILLGVLAAAHAQKDPSSDSVASGESARVDSRPVPTPIEDFAGSSAEIEGADSFGADSFGAVSFPAPPFDSAPPTDSAQTSNENSPSDVMTFGEPPASLAAPPSSRESDPPAVRLVQHAEVSEASPQEDAFAPPADDFPSGDFPADGIPAAMTPPSLAMPDAATIPDAATMPDAATIPDAATMPELAFDESPAASSLGFPDPPGSGPEAHRSEADNAAPSGSHPPVNELRQSSIEAYPDESSPHSFGAPSFVADDPSLPEGKQFDAPGSYEPTPAVAPPPEPSPASSFTSGARDVFAPQIPQPQDALTPRYPAHDVGQAPPVLAEAPAPPSADRIADRSAALPRTISSPGDRRLEGAQSPSIVIQKRAPAEVKVGKPASFVIHLRNVGSTEAIDVQLFDRVPDGMRLVDASPSPEQRGDELRWQLGALRAGEERTVTLELIPEQEGELGSVARVSFEAAASVRTISTRPELKITQRAPEAVLIGQQLEIELEVSNPGTGEATGVVLQADVPAGLEHPKGRQLDNLLGNLQPGETRREVLRLRAVAPGQIENSVRLVSDDGLTAEHKVSVEVVAPQLQVRLNGPTRRYVERQATYDLQIANVGTAEATNVEIAAYLDRGFTFVSTGNQGQYDPARHAVFWSLARLPTDAGDTVPLTLLPVETGEQAIRLEASADLGVEAQHEQAVAVDSLAELSFQVADVADPIELGAETTYEIRVANSGSRDDSNVRVQLQLPAGLELLSSDVDAETDGRGGVFFQPRPQLASGAELTYRVKVRGTAPGRHVVKATIVSDQSNVEVTKEESTMVYADR